ncbi:metal ABC transporter solute-binding protein, Zn/Mn family [Weissella kandleri]|uniref:metal ABC transporter solute-binding protein, Zn/Mn family n=1 Tax=Weissella kandleri TaxID=1616 RepID=UPI00387EE50C
MKQHKNINGWLGLIVVVSLVGLILHQAVLARPASFQQSTVASPKKLKIVSSLSVYGEMAQAIVGKYGEVVNIVGPHNGDPHDFEPTLQTAKTYAQADLIISNGGGYDEWAHNLSAAHAKTPQIEVSHLVSYQEGDNEHFWYRPQIAQVVTAALVEQLSRQDEQHQAYYQRRAQNYLATLAPLQQMRDDIKSQLAGKMILTTEPVYDNALAGWSVHIGDQEFAQAVEAGNDPSPQAIEQWNRALEKKRVSLVIENTQTTNRITQQAVKKARQAGVPVVGVTESQPAEKNYYQWQMDILQAIKTGLEA